ncbi:Rad59p [Kluyveromyces lactis]|uniref:DNA repair protein RAD59 n=1 Tax=Kluyveromyces lactis (strain ATCC 8585 / CBS 2359 / DSM 70799 / NBRC 1267 / NRRL Y-1140 / WM37) TaxID=284590 RepID=RAD59_KLULA|nr:uncharacterized protein KLLA0_E05259g [Kluyveromyces lactis]Q9HEU2.1 RecName: Full=DNA repair protein RAD59 [Kluyveromyces lactis NRRL Y-1140]AAG45224.1 recombination protein Rad59 [Kluyveromyces lactis]CAG99269.1 KLLA0E05259p [Kluyveromyces lactis]|eukprot:XP_454182.1 uncharacterized protein KLLA0_E05259g [Kluyveromyces lactis]
MSRYTDISYEGTSYTVNTGLDIKDFQIEEDWYNRPASEWSVKRIGQLQGKVEQYTYRIYHSNKYGKHNLARLIPGHVLISFANECFGYDGWSSEVEEITSLEHTENAASEDKRESHTVLAEARVKLVLKDDTYTFAGGFGKSTMPFKGEAFAKAKKEAITDALKNCLLGFEKVILDHEIKIKQNYYVDGVFKAEMSKIEGKTSIPRTVR